MVAKITSDKLLRAGLQSGTIMALADTATQLFIEDQKGWRRLWDTGSVRTQDWTRTLRWGVAGLICHGPYFFVGFSVIDKYIGAQAAVPTLRTVAQKTLVAQLVLFPPYLVMLFGLMGVLEGKSTQKQIIQKVKDRVPEAFAGGCIYWYVVQTFRITNVLVPTARGGGKTLN